jgi:hypothetical protein
VVAASANGAIRAEVEVGEPVTLGVVAEVPPDAGTVVSVEWDFDGLGTWPYRAAGIDGTQAVVELDVEHAYEKPGTYFPAVRVLSHRDGDVGATTRRIENIGRARVVVR